MSDSGALNASTLSQDRIGLGIAGILAGMAAVSVMDALAKWLEIGRAHV